jgi:hypothetical protein
MSKFAEGHEDLGSNLLANPNLIHILQDGTFLLLQGSQKPILLSPIKGNFGAHFETLY